VLYVACNAKVLHLFESGQAPSLDLSDFDLRLQDCTPLFQALHSERSLTSITLSGNRLRDEAMPQLRLALDQLPALRALDLSATGITCRVSGLGGWGVAGW
jgi:Ran GTPase-activating protein (RanGAP) involved in mRNA processing and transport